MLLCDVIFEIKYLRAESERPSLIPPTSGTNTHHDVRSGNYGNAKSTKKSISQEQKVTFYEIKKFAT